MNQVTEWLQDEWMRDFLVMMAVWAVGVTVASAALVLYGPAMY